LGGRKLDAGHVACYDYYVRIFAIVAIMVLGCAPAMKNLTPPSLGFVLPMDFPETYAKKNRRRSRKKRHKRHKTSKKISRRPRGTHTKLPAMIIVGTDSSALIRRGLIWSANLVSGVKKSFDDGSFAAYIFYVNDLSQFRKSDIKQCLNLTSKIPASRVNAGDIVVMDRCETGRELGVITAVCKQGFFVTSYCTGRVESLFIKHKTSAKKTCKAPVKTLNGRVISYRTLKKQ